MEADREWLKLSEICEILLKDLPSATEPALSTMRTRYRTEYDRRFKGLAKKASRSFVYHRDAIEVWRQWRVDFENGQRWENCRPELKIIENPIGEPVEHLGLITKVDERSSALGAIDAPLDILTKVKSVIFAQWQGGDWLTTQQVAEFYEVSDRWVRQVYSENEDEFNGLVEFTTGNQLKDWKERNSEFRSRSNTVTLWNPRAVLLLGFILTQSEVSRAIRSAVLDFLAELPRFVQQVQSAPFVSANDHIEIKLDRCLSQNVQIDEKLDELLLSLERLNSSWAEEREQFERKQSEILEEIKVLKRAKKWDREDFRTKIKLNANQICFQQFRGYCPYRPDIRIFDEQGSPIVGVIQYHHLNRLRNDTRLENCLPVSKQGHDEFHQDPDNPKWQRIHMVWEWNVEEFNRSNNPVLPLEWS